MKVNQLTNTHTTQEKPLNLDKRDLILYYQINGQGQKEWTTKYQQQYDKKRKIVFLFYLFDCGQTSKANWSKMRFFLSTTAFKSNHFASHSYEQNIPSQKITTIIVYATKIILQSVDIFSWCVLICQWACRFVSLLGFSSSIANLHALRRYYFGERTFNFLLLNKRAW